MTVSTTGNAVVYRGNGSATAFAVTFKVLDEDHLVVTRRVYETGEEDHVYIGTDYSYSGIGDSSGTLTLAGAALTSTYEIVIERIVPYTQDLDIVNEGGFFPESVEEQLDTTVMAIQQLANEVARTIRVAPGETLEPFVPASGREDTVVTFDDTGQLELLSKGSFPAGPAGSVEISGMEFYTPMQYGATRLQDNPTFDSYAAFQAAIDAMPNTGGEFWIPRGAFRLSQRLLVPKAVTIRGCGSGTRSYVYGEYTDAERLALPAWQNYSGSVLVFDANSGGMFLPLHTDVSDTDTVVANAGGTASNPTYWEYPGALGYRLENFVMLGSGTGTETAHGIEARAGGSMQDVLVTGFAGDGVLISASADFTSTGSSYGNANDTLLLHIDSSGNRGNGFRVIGRDVNVTNLINCRAALNGAWGYKDMSGLGIKLSGCHAATNNTRAASFVSSGGTIGASADASMGSFYSDQTSAPTIFDSCYAEGGNGAGFTAGPSVIIMGGILSGIGTTDTPGEAYVQRGNILGQAGLRHINNRGTVTVGVSFGEGAATHSIWAFGSSDERSDVSGGGNSFELTYNTTHKYWSLAKPGAATLEPIGYANRLTDVQRISPFLPNGLFLGSPIQGLGNHIRHSNTFTIASPGLGVYAKRDIILKGPSHPDAVAGGKIGFVCTAGGVRETTAWASGVSLTPVLGNQSQGVYRTNASNVYKLTAKTGTGNTADAPVHGAGAVTGADGYEWTFMNTTSFPTFKEWGAIDA